MVAKRVVKVTKRKTKRKATVSELSDSAVMAVLESKQLETRTIDPEVRRQLVAAEAYFFAERRGFAAGNEVQDWVAAEVVVDSRLKQRVA
jgi:Protein of unknown function (DUF2934)